LLRRSVWLGKTATCALIPSKVEAGSSSFGRAHAECNRTCWIFRPNVKDNQTAYIGVFGPWMPQYPISSPNTNIQTLPKQNMTKNNILFTKNRIKNLHASYCFI
jgi:hypothetical protein